MYAHWPICMCVVFWVGHTTRHNTGGRLVAGAGPFECMAPCGRTLLDVAASRRHMVCGCEVHANECGATAIATSHRVTHASPLMMWLGDPFVQRGCVWGEADT